MSYNNNSLIQKIYIYMYIYIYIFFKKQTFLHSGKRNNGPAKMFTSNPWKLQVYYLT